MVTLRFYIISGIYLIIICLGLISCDIRSDEDYAQAPEVTSISLPPNEVFPQVEDESYFINGTFDSIDYSQYLMKNWVADDWGGGVYIYPLSFFITGIENSAIRGKFRTRAVAVPDFYYYRFDTWLGDLAGVVNNNIAECSFSNELGDKGIITLLFEGDDRIVATLDYEEVEFMKKEDYYNDLRRIYARDPEFYNRLLPMDGTYVFRPYNITDVEHRIDPCKTRLFVIDLDSWGTVSFITVVSSDNKPTPFAYLTNDYGDILYEFSAPFQTGTELIDIVVEDMNGDGLKDIMIITDYDEVTWYFYQMDNGLFYDGRLLQQTDAHNITTVNTRDLYENLT
ncbi:MAG: hypothetical protein FWH52_06425 [Synergistaceae bacterium]|nr:hypothetical protein [Synergistaceae bacterium]